MREHILQQVPLTNDIVTRFNDGGLESLEPLEVCAVGKAISVRLESVGLPSWNNPGNVAKTINALGGHVQSGNRSLLRITGKSGIPKTLKLAPDSGVGKSAIIPSLIASAVESVGIKLDFNDPESIVKFARLATTYMIIKIRVN